jgi:hypothetical protein
MKLLFYLSGPRFDTGRSTKGLGEAKIKAVQTEADTSNLVL